LKTHMNLIFGTTAGNSYTVRVPDSVDSTNVSLVRSSMNRMIEANAVDTNGRGDLSTRQLARLYRTEEIIFDVS